jgi:hypothetical protein
MPRPSTHLPSGLESVPVETEDGWENHIAVTELTTGSAPAGEKISKQLLSDLEKMEVAILARNWKKATYSAWCKVACEYSVEREAVTGKIINKAWSEDKFGRLLKKLIEQGRSGTLTAVRAPSTRSYSRSGRSRRARASSRTTIQPHRRKMEEGPINRIKKNPQKQPAPRISLKGRCGQLKPPALPASTRKAPAK